MAPDIALENWRQCSFAGVASVQDLFRTINETAPGNQLDVGVLRASRMVRIKVVTERMWSR